MTLTSFLHYLDNNSVDLWVENNKLYAGAEKELPHAIKEYAKDNRQALKQRLLDNDFAKSRSWLVANYGEVYAYRYSSSGYIFIERHSDETVDIYRCRFNENGEATDIKGLHEGVTFSLAYQKVKAFLDWYYTKNPHMLKGYY
jgi:hypothetical protein